MERIALASLLVLAACAPPAHGPAGPASGKAECRYHVALLPGDDAELDVHARCDAPVRAFEADEHEVADLIRADVDGRPIAANHGEFAPGGSALHYRLSLAEAARRFDDIDVAYASGGGYMTSVSTWLLDPSGLDGARVAIDVEVPDGQGFATGLGREDGAWRIDAGDIAVSTYAVFGRFDLDRIDVPGPRGASAIEVATLPGELAATRDQRVAWIRASAQAVGAFYRGFPVDRLLVVVVPIAGRDEVVHGKVVAAGGATVALQLGSRVPEPELYRDWILVHELFHLGFPSFRFEGRWLDEGLATYFEPIIRARAGWRSGDAVWDEFSRDMWRGLDAVEHTGLLRARSNGGIYWGGALVSLLADVKERRATGGKLGLEDGVRAVLAEGGDATHTWTLDHAVEVIDQRLGSPVLRGLVESHAKVGSPVHFHQLLGALGVRRTDDGVELSDDALLASVRKAIIDPPRP